MSESTLTTTVDLLDGMAFQATTGSGHELVLDAAADMGGTERGPRPIDLLLVGLGGCTGMDVISILRKMRQDVTGYAIRLRGHRASDHPRVFTSIQVEHVVRGRALSPDSVRRAVELSASRYCSAAAMLGQVARIDETYRIVDEVSGRDQAGALPLGA
jgi:putative redox protein